MTRRAPRSACSDDIFIVGVSIPRATQCQDLIVPNPSGDKRDALVLVSRVAYVPIDLPKVFGPHHHILPYCFYLR